MLQEKSKNKLSEDTIRFLNYLETFQMLVSRHQFQVRTYSKASLGRFLSLSEANQRKTIQKLTQYLSYLTKCSEESLDLSFDSLLVQTFLKKSNYIFDKSFLDSVQPDDVIEIYDMEPVQIFRNLRFLDLCNYSMMDLLSHEPYELYERSEQVNQHLMEAAGTLINRPFDLSPIDLSYIPKHLIRERFSDRKLTSTVQFKQLYPLYIWPQQLAGFLLIQEGSNTVDLKRDVVFL